jgi:hypothetical protein
VRDVKSLNDYRNFAMAHWGFNEREADKWAEHALEIEESNRELIAMQQGKIFRPRTQAWRVAQKEREDYLWNLPD